MKILSKKTLILLFLILLFLISTSSAIWASKKKKTGPEDITFLTQDGFNLVGNLYRPKNASLKNKVPVVLLLHSIGANSRSWKNFPVKLTNSGKAVFTLDMRGHGGSIYNKNNKRRDWINFQDKDFKKYPDDINALIKYLKDNCPDINSSKVGIVAANVSANASIIAAKNNNKVIKTLVLLSPAISYKGIDPRIPMVGYDKNPVLIMVSKKDRYSFNGSTELLKYAQGTKKLKAFPNGGNGVDLLRFQPQAEPMIVDWLNKHLK